MNIEDLRSDIKEMESDLEILTPNVEEVLKSMKMIEYLYDEDDFVACMDKIEAHQKQFGVKINIM